jgi:hypothetical protein
MKKNVPFHAIVIAIAIAVMRERKYLLIHFIRMKKK